MKIFFQLAIIIGFALVGTLISYLLGLANIPFPGSLIGMILLFIFLMIGWIKERHIKETADFMVKNMGIFFVPPAVAILNNLSVISPIWWKILIVIFASFLINFAAVFYSTKLTLIIQQKIKNKKKDKEEAK